MLSWSPLPCTLSGDKNKNKTMRFIDWLTWNHILVFTSWFIPHELTWGWRLTIVGRGRAGRSNAQLQPDHKPERMSSLEKICEWWVVRFCWLVSVTVDRLTKLLICTFVRFQKVHFSLFSTVVCLARIFRSSIDLGYTLGIFPNV
jgi:hypothetical protein